MKVSKPHPWKVTVGEARHIQEKLRKRVQLKAFRKTPRYVAGADLSWNRGGKYVYAAVVLLDFISGETLESHSARSKVSFPYVPGYLSFREIPALIPLFEKLSVRPDVIIVDGHGISHPRGLGIATHLGIILGIPTIGCAKSILVGEHSAVPHRKGSQRSLKYLGKKVGVAFRNRSGVRPIFVSPGHLMDFESAIKIVKLTSAGYRIPETTRHAHRLVNELRRTAS